MRHWMIHMCTRFNKIWHMTIACTTRRANWFIYFSLPCLFLSLSLALRSNSFDIKGFLLLLACCIVCDAFQIAHTRNEFPSHSDHNFYHHIQQFASPTTAGMESTELFHNSSKKGKPEEKYEESDKKWGRKKKKSFSFLMLLSNAAVDTWYGKKCRWQNRNGGEKKIDENRAKIEMEKLH